MMNTQKIRQVILVIALGWLTVGCQTQSATVTPTTISPTVAAKGIITGVVYLMAPPTPPMVIYAVDPTTGVWVSTETQQTDGEASYTLEVVPGTYQVFGAMLSGTSVVVGYDDASGTQLGLVTVGAGQTVDNITVRAPSQNECGALYGLPASPDGRFTAAAGPSGGCLAVSNVNMAGQWEDTQSGFILDLVQTAADIVGRHVVVAQQGNKIDALDGNTIHGTLQGNVATVQFQSSFTQDVGTAQITYVDSDTITWKIIIAPGGEYYLPAEATLVRK